MDRYTYKFTPNEDYSIPNNNYGEQTDYIITDGVYGFDNWLWDNGVSFEHDAVSDTYLCS